MGFRERMKERREALGLTLDDVAHAVGVGKATVQRWESGQIKNMGRDKIALLSEVLGISPIEVIGEQRSPVVDMGSRCVDPQELVLLEAYREADERAQRDAMLLLKAHKKEE